jgi:hypothetical protein
VRVRVPAPPLLLLLRLLLLLLVLRLRLLLLRPLGCVRLPRAVCLQLRCSSLCTCCAAWHPDSDLTSHSQPSA